LLASSRKSSKSGKLPTGKIIPQQHSCRLRNEWNGAAPLTVSDAKPNRGACHVYRSRRHPDLDPDSLAARRHL